MPDSNHRALNFKCRTFLSVWLRVTALVTCRWSWSDSWVFFFVFFLLLGFWLKPLGKYWGHLLRWGKSENYPVCEGKSGLRFDDAKFQMPLMYRGRCQGRNWKCWYECRAFKFSRLCSVQAHNLIILLTLSHKNEVQLQTSGCLDSR